MILVDSTAGLAVVLAGAQATAASPVHVVSREVNPLAPSYTPKMKLDWTTGTSAVVMQAAAANAGIFYLVDYASILNNDSANITVTFAVGFFPLVRATLVPGERLQYTDANGWQVFSTNGGLKVTQNQGDSPTTSARQIVTLGADVTNNNATANTIADVTGLSFAVIAGNRYYFKAAIDYTAAATATGSRWSISGPASPTRLAYDSDYGLTATTVTMNRGQNAYDLPAAANATSVSTTGNLAIVEGFITPSANGTVIVRFASEVASSAIIAKRGSTIEWLQV